jgi:hypothetical protein
MDSRSLRQGIVEREPEISALTAKTLGREKGNVHSQIRDLRRFIEINLRDLRKLSSSDENALAMRMELAKHIEEITILPGEEELHSIKYNGKWDLLGHGQALCSWDGAEGQNRTGYAGLFRAALYQ